MLVLVLVATGVVVLEVVTVVLVLVDVVVVGVIVVGYDVMVVIVSVYGNVVSTHVIVIVSVLLPSYETFTVVRLNRVRVPVFVIVNVIGGKESPATCGITNRHGISRMQIISILEAERCILLPLSLPHLHLQAFHFDFEFDFGDFA